MKILHVVSSYWPAFEFGGPIKTVHSLNKFLVKKGIEPTVYTTNAGLRGNKNIPLKERVDLDGVEIFYFPYYGYVHWTFSPALFWALAKNIRKFDLIHITGVWNFPVCAAAFWARVYKKPYIISTHGSLMKEPLQKKSPLKKWFHLLLIGKRDLKNASAIHFTVEIEREEYIKTGLPLKKAVIIPNGLDPADLQSFDGPRIDFKKKFGIGPDKKIVLFLGRLMWKKGFDTLIPAFNEVVKKELKAILVLVGSDDENYKGVIDKMIDKYNLKDRVIFTGLLLGTERAAAFETSEVFVLPSYSENFGMAVIEAMYFGLPVIITKNVGISPSVEKFKAGLIIEKDEKKLTEAIWTILNNPDLAKKMGENGKRLIEEEFSPEKIADKWIKIYQET